MTFGQRALLAAALLGSALPVVGTFVVRRGMALVGDGLGHVAFAGVALATLFGVAPVPFALLFTVLGAVGVEVIRWKSQGRSDLAIAFIFYASMALAVVTLAASRSYNARVLGVLFGSLLTLSDSELVLMGFVVVAAALLMVACYRPLVAIAVDEELAAASGISARRYGMLVTVSTAMAVVAGMPAVGVLLVSALLVLPSAAAQNLVSGFRRSLAASSALGMAVAVGGTAAALGMNVPPSALTVLAASSLYLASLAVKRG